MCKWEFLPQEWPFAAACGLLFPRDHRADSAVLATALVNREGPDEPPAGALGLRVPSSYTLKRPGGTGACRRDVNCPESHCSVHPLGRPSATRDVPAVHVCLSPGCFNCYPMTVPAGPGPSTPLVRAGSVHSCTPDLAGAGPSAICRLPLARWPAR